MRHYALRALFLVALVLTAASLPARAHADDHVMSSPSCCPWGLLTQTLDGVVTDAWAVPWEENANPVHFQPLPDGGAVFDTGASGAPDPGIWLERPGRGLLRLTDGKYDYNPSATHDGSKVVFSRWDPATNTRDIYEVNGDGSGLVRLTNGMGLADFETARFSPDGSTIAFTCVVVPYAYTVGKTDVCRPQLDGGYWYHGILLMNADGTNKRMIQRAETDDLAWSPDGQWLAEIADIPVDLGNDLWTGEFDLYVFKTDGSDLFADEARVRYVKLADDPNAIRPVYPNFSADGSRIGFCGIVPAENWEYPMVVNRDGTGLRRLALSRTICNFQFVPAAGGGAPPPTVDATHIVVPAVRGSTVRAADKRLDARHLYVAGVRRSYSTKYRRGRVIATKPAAGAKAHRPDEDGAPVTIFVSKGRKPVRHH